MHPTTEPGDRLGFAIDREAFEALLERVVTRTLSAIDWPPGRIALNELEAAQALGVKRHVLRDARLTGLVGHITVGKRICYRRGDLLAYVDRQAISQQGGVR